MELTFATPLGALVALFALLPFAGAAVRERRLRRVRRALRLAGPDAAGHRRTAAALAAFFGLLGLAAAQPLLALEQRVGERSDAEAFVVVDVSRSMLASESAGAPTRFRRAVALARKLRARLPEVPTGVGSLTDRLLPHLFPTGDRRLFDTVVERVLAVDRPPPSDRRQGRATALGMLVALGRDNYFSAESARRLAFVLTDGESLPFDPAGLSRQLAEDGVGLVLVRLGSQDERIFRPDGSIEEGYRPVARDEGLLAELAASTAGGRVFSEGEAEGALAAARAYLGEGPLVESVSQRRRVPLGGWLALAASVPLALLVVSALPAGRLRLG